MKFSLELEYLRSYFLASREKFLGKNSFLRFQKTRGSTSGILGVFITLMKFLELINQVIKLSSVVT